MYAVISDIHGNLEALEAVLAAIELLRVRRIICLGDVTCYGPDSLECIRRSADWEIVLSGRFDEALLAADAPPWNDAILQHLRWVKSEIEGAHDSAELIAIMRGYRNRHLESGVLLTHGAPEDNSEFIFPEDSYCPAKLNRIGEQFERVCISASSHIPGIYRQLDEQHWQFTEPRLATAYSLDGQRAEQQPEQTVSGTTDNNIIRGATDKSLGAKTIVTTGSVGQPRDGDPRASFLTVDDNALLFHRVEYDATITAKKIVAIPEIDNMHGDRLHHGR